jgi:uncharacterized delta-60 repeat protein
MAIQPDGKIVGAGWTSGSPHDFALARYNTDGSLDETFGTGGKVTTDFFGLDDEIEGITITPNGRVIAVGGATTAGSAGEDFALACYLTEAILPPPPLLEITGAEVQGKRLIVYGKNFEMGAELLMNGEKQKKTFNDDVNPTTVLIAKKSGKKKIAPGQTVTLQVRNPDGTLSNEFLYTRPVE